MSSSLPVEQAIPLCVDLDGTLIRTDSLVETVALFLKQHFLMIVLLPFWLQQGRARLKEEIALRVKLDVAYLPYEQLVLNEITKAKSDGREVILCTGANWRYATDVSEHLGVFDDVIASDISTNLTGEQKRLALTERFGDQGYDYMGNDRHDLSAFRHARKSLLVSPTASLRRSQQQLVNAQILVPAKKTALKSYLSQLRLHQWMKNILLFIALLASQRFYELQAILVTILAFFAFGFCASSVYVLNDLMDLPVDRRHPRKRLRPFASGEIPASQAVLLIPLLAASGFLLASFLSLNFILVLLLYFFISLNYNLWAKNLAVLDTLFLAGLYTLRILAGAAAIGVAPSFWLLAFSMFFFLSVALAKRYSELVSLDLTGEQLVPGRQYRSVDLNTLISQGISSGHVAVLVMALYINSAEVLESYTHPQIIWLTCPLLLYWINKLWLNAQRGEMHDDPLVWAIENRVSRGIAVLFTLLMILAY